MLETVQRASMHAPMYTSSFFRHMSSTYRHIQENIANKIGLILSFSLILIWGARVPVVRIGRIAGQYAKPRSSATEKLPDGQEVLSFR